MIVLFRLPTFVGNGRGSSSRGCERFASSWCSERLSGLGDSREMDFEAGGVSCGKGTATPRSVKVPTTADFVIVKGALRGEGLLGHR